MMSPISISFLLLIFCALFLCKINAQCRPKKFPLGIVCVCDANFCDEFPPIGNLSARQAAIYVSSGDGKRFERASANFEGETESEAPITIRLNPSQQFQNIIGFGGAFTDSAGFNLNRLSAKARQKLLSAYFAEEGIGYTLSRVIMASCDFSPRVYSYDDLYADPLQCPILLTPIKCLLSLLTPLTNTKTDFELEHFNLTAEDFAFKIPHIKMAMGLMPVGERLKLFATPFSAPAWMKWTGYMEGGGPLKGDVDGPYYRTWAKYFIRYFEEYAKEGINFWGLTMQNEPRISVIPIWWQGTSFTAEQQRDFLKLWLGPALKNSAVAKNLKILIMDDQRTFLPSFPNIVLSDPEAAKFVDGIGLHWYFDTLTAPDGTLVATHNAHPDKFMIGTEASQGYLPGQGPSLGDWGRAENYAENIIQDLQNWVTGWTEWNLCLDEKGGPTWVTTVVHGLDATIIVNNTADEFYKQPMYYAIGHFSKFIRPGSRRIDLTISTDGSSQLTDILKLLNGVAFVTPVNQTVLVLHNKNALKDYQISIEIENSRQKLNLNVEHKSISTIIWDNF